jgi:hypothetical protein
VVPVRCAAILHGVARLTADVDVTVRLPEAASTTSVVAALESHGFRVRFTDSEFIERTRVIPFVHLATSLPVDLVLAGPGLEDRFFARVVVRTIDGVRVPVASAEDVIIMKVLAGRPKDIDDIVVIAASSRETLDVAYIRQTLSDLERALSQSDLAPVFEDARARSRPRPRS